MKENEANDYAWHLNHRQKDQDVFYLATPADVGDHFSFMQDYQKQINNINHISEKRKDRNGKYTVWKCIITEDNTKKKSIKPIARDGQPNFK